MDDFAKVALFFLAFGALTGASLVGLAWWIAG